MDQEPTPSTSLSSDGAILDSLGLAVMAVDERCRIVRFNETAERLTGYPAREVVGLVCADVLRASLCTSRCPLREALRTGSTCRSATVVLQGRDERPVTAEVTASVLCNDEGTIVGAVGIFRDMAEDPGVVRLYGSRQFISRTPAMRRVFEALPGLAASHSPLLIVGGRGSGRSALAEAIHTLGDGTRGRPLLRVPCAAPEWEERLDQALEQAGGGGTLLLEELCGGADAIQQQLLAWIEDEGASSDLRVISTATHRLQECMQQGTFRRELFFRLDVLHVVIPTLRERGEDIPLLVREFIEDLNGRRGRQVEGISPTALARLQGAELPGNVRQLRMVVEQAHRRCSGRLIQPPDLPELSSANPGSVTDHVATRCSTRWSGRMAA